MEKRPIQSKGRYILSFVIGTALFLLIFVISSAVSYFEFGRVSVIQGQLAYDIFVDKLDYSLFDKEGCNEEVSEKISSDLSAQGRIIDDLERKLGKNNKQVLFRKQFYTLVELEHFEYIQNLKEYCGKDVNTLFFFYSNEKDDLEKAEELGRLLDVVGQRNSNLFIYSFDINLESELIEKLKFKYGIDQPGVLVINNQFVLINPGNPEVIEKLLN